MMILVLFGILFLAIFLGIPICFSLGLSAAASLLIFEPNTNIVVLAQKIFTQADNYVFMAVPFFMLAGELMLRGGISKRLIGFVKAALWWLPANLACITTVASMFFGAISGSNPATVSAIGGMMCPEMKKDGYSEAEAGAIAAASGTLGVIIPPSIPMVVYGIAASVSVTKLFVAGILPGIILAILLCLTSMWIMRHDKRDRRAIKEELNAQGMTGWKALKEASGALFMPILILGGIYGGMFTPTEAGVVSALYAFVISRYVYKELSWGDFLDCVKSAGINTGTILIVCACSSPFAWFMTSQGIPGLISKVIISLVHSRIMILLAINIILLILGCFLDTSVIILLTTPILLPVAAAVGISPIVLGIIMVINTSVGMITPPMAVNLYIASRVSECSIEGICKKIIPFLTVEIIFVVIISYFPGLILWMPNLVG